MNLNDSEFEQQLRSLRPLAPSLEMAETIARELEPRALIPAAGRTLAAARAISGRPAMRWRGFLNGFGWAAAGACAAVAAIVAFERPAPVPANTARAAAFEFTESSAELVAAEDEGLVNATGREPARRVRYRSIERHVLMDAETGARMEIEIPREDVQLIPVNMQ